MGVTDPLGGINVLFPLFGIANQLLAAVALSLVVVVTVKKGLLKWVWIPGLPLLWDVAVTMTASYQKIFSDNPAIGYWAQHTRYKNALAEGKTSFGTAKSVEAMEAVVRNTAVQGFLSVLFAVLVIIVLIAATVVCIRAVGKIKRGEEVHTSEEPFHQSNIFAPTSLGTSDVEKVLVKAWNEYDPPKAHAHSHH